MVDNGQCRKIQGPIDQLKSVSEVMNNDKDAAETLLTKSFSSNAIENLSKELEQTYEFLENEVVQAEGTLQKTAALSDNPIQTASDSISQVISMALQDSFPVRQSVPGLRPLRGDSGDDSSSLDPTGDLINDDPFYQDLFDAQAQINRYQVITKLNTVAKMFNSMVNILEEFIQQAPGDRLQEYNGITTIKIVKLTDITIGSTSEIRLQSGQNNGLPIDQPDASSNVEPKLNDIRQVRVKLDAIKQRRSTKSPSVSLLSENPYRGVDSTHMDNPVLLIKHFNGKVQYTQEQWPREPVVSTDDLKSINVFRFEVPNNRAPTDYTINFESPTASTQAVIDVWISYNLYPLPDENQFYEKLTLPSTSGDSIFSATTPDCDPYATSLGQDCSGDLMAIYISKKQIQVCKHRSQGSCVIFIAYKLRSIMTNIRLINVYLSGHSCPNLNSSDTVEWVTSDCTVSPVSNNTATVCDCDVQDDATYSTSFLVPPKLLLSKIGGGCLSCSLRHTLTFFFVIASVAALFLALIRHQARGDLKSIELVDRCDGHAHKYIVVIETQLGHVPSPSDIVYVKPVMKQPRRNWLNGHETDEFFANIGPSPKFAYWDTVWKLKPNHGFTFESSSKFKFLCSSVSPLENVSDCVVWIPFQGRTRTWRPKSITIRRLAISLAIADEVGYVSDLSTPLYKFTYEGKISLMENISLKSIQMVRYEANGLVRQDSTTQQNPASFSERLGKYFIQRNLWLNCYLIRSYLFFNRSARLLCSFQISANFLISVLHFQKPFEDCSNDTFNWTSNKHNILRNVCK